MTPKLHFIGTGLAVADEMIRWIDGGAADGFILGFPVTAEGLDDFDRLVLPELEARSRYDRAQVGRTLRDHRDCRSSRIAMSFDRRSQQSEAATGPL